METKNFLESLLSENRGVHYNEVLGVQGVELSKEEASVFIASLNRVNRLLLRTRINRNELASSYAAHHATATELKAATMRAAFWKALKKMM